MSLAAVVRSATDEELALLERALTGYVSKAATPSPRERQRLMREHQARLEEYAARLLAAQQPWYQALRDEVVANIDRRFAVTAKAEGPIVIETLLFDRDGAHGALTAALEADYLEAYERAGMVSYGSIHGGAFSLLPDAGLDALACREIVMKTVVDDAQDRLRQSLADGIREGETRLDLIKRADEWMVEGREHYAQTVARTETASALNEGMREGYVEAGCTRKTWLSIVDEGSREDHAALNGVSIPFDEQFELDSGLWDGPHDPGMGPEDVCNCRCMIAGGYGDTAPTEGPLADYQRQAQERRDNPPPPPEPKRYRDEKPPPRGPIRTVPTTPPRYPRFRDRHTISQAMVNARAEGAAGRAWASSLADHELKSVVEWTTWEPMRAMRGVSKGRITDAYHVAKHDALVRAMDKGTPYKGTVYRGVSNKTQTEAAKLVPGARWPCDAISSTSTDENIARTFQRGIRKLRTEPGNVGILFEMEQSVAVPIYEASTMPWQAEALMPKGTVFEIVDVSQKTSSAGRTYMRVRMRQVEP